jgi:exopolysaccharide biosynthesis polyprenyl glycosylphosphotransferase
MSAPDSRHLPWLGSGVGPWLSPVGAILLLADGVGVVAPALILNSSSVILRVAFAELCFVALRGRAARTSLRPYLTHDLPRLVGRIGAATLVAIALAAAVRDTDGLVPLALMTAFFVLVGRFVVYSVIRAARSRGALRENALIVGAGDAGVRVARTLVDHPEFGLVPKGFVEARPRPELPLPVVGHPSQLAELVPECDARRVIVTFGGVRDADLVGILRRCSHIRAQTDVIPRFFELGGLLPTPDLEIVWGLPLIHLRRSVSDPLARAAKRLVDVLAASTLLVLSLPVLGFVTIAVGLSGPGPIFFRQKRVGKEGRVFELIKFRTMRVNDDSDTTWNVGPTEERITPVGNMLRRTCLDELPQLLNVIRGEMSLVGPRPERPYFADQFEINVRGYEDRHRVSAGMTGWAQIHGLRGDTSIDDRVFFDNAYIDHWSLWRDLHILMRTAGSILRGGKG